MDLKLEMTEDEKKQVRTFEEQTVKLQQILGAMTADFDGRK